MIRLLSILLLSMVFLNVKGQFPDTCYIYTFGGKKIDIGKDIIQTYNNNYIIAGTTSSFGNGNTDIYLIKLDSLKNRVWSKTYGYHGIEQCSSIIENYDSTIYIIGYTNSIGNGGYDILLIQIDSNGNKLFEKTYGGIDWDFGVSAVMTNDSNIVICGYSYSFNNTTKNIYTIKIDKNRETIWEKSISNIIAQEAKKILIENNSILICGYEQDNNGDKNGILIKMDMNGNVLWRKNYGSLKNDELNSITITNDGNYLLCGYTDSLNSGSTAFWMLKVDTSGNYIWQHIYDVTSSDDAFINIIEISSNKIYAIGNTFGGFGGKGIYMFMGDSGGWWQSAHTLGGAYDEISGNCIINNKNEFVGIGSTKSYGEGDYDYYLFFLYPDHTFLGYTQFVTNIIEPLSLYNIPTGKQNSLFPNPSSGIFNIYLDNTITLSNSHIEISTLSGQMIYKKSINFHLSTIETDLENGMYIINIFNDNQNIYTNKLIILR